MNVSTIAVDFFGFEWIKSRHALAVACVAKTAVSPVWW